MTKKRAQNKGGLRALVPVADEKEEEVKVRIRPAGPLTASGEEPIWMPRVYTPEEEEERRKRREHFAKLEAEAKARKQERLSRPVVVGNQDSLARMNFMLQAAVAVGRPDVARFYVNTFERIREKAVLRISRPVSHLLCRTKGCHTVLVPGRSASVRRRGKHSRKRSGLVCHACGQKR